MRRSCRLAWALVVVLSVAATAGCATGSETSSKGGQTVTINGPADFEYTIPAGTGALADDGRHSHIFPDRLVARLGQTIRITNNDSRTHHVGPFSIGAGKTLTQRFSSVGEFIGECSTHPGGQFTLVVQA